MIRAGATRRGPLAIRTSGGRPSWLPPDAVFVADFVNQRYFWNNSLQPFSGVTFNRSTEAWGLDASNNIVNYPVDSPRIGFNAGVRDGIYTHSQRSNLCTFSDTPDSQTINITLTGNHVLWCAGNGSVTITAGTGTATGLGTATSSGGWSGQTSGYLNFNVTGTGTFDLLVSGSLIFIQCERENTAPTTIVPRPGPPIVTGSTAVSVAVDRMRVSGLTNLSTTQGAVVANVRSVGPVNFARFVSLGTTSVETAGTSAVVLLTNDGNVLYFARYSLFPTTTFYDPATIGVSWANASGTLVFNGAPVGTSTAWVAPSSAVDTVGLGSTPNFSANSYNGHIRRVVLWGTTRTDAQLIAAGVF